MVVEGFIDLVKVKDGESGKTQYLHIMYSDVEEPTDSDITAIPTTYIGICVDENKTAPSTASSYTWAKFQGSDGKDGIGIKGDKGEDGLTQYTHIKFSDDAKNFTANNGDTPGRYIGFFVDHNEDAVLAEEFYEPWIPIRGADGVNGGTGFFYVAYSANPNGYPMTTEPQEDTKYMGVYSGVEGETVTDYTKFTWTRIQGNDGIDGVDGKDGKAYYTWVKYANSATPTEMSDVPDGMDYIGIAYNKETRVESDDPNDYAWSLLRGEQGIQGIPGEKGQPLYTWIKYADTPTTGMSDTPEGKNYMGISYNNETIEESDDYSDYQWVYIRGEQGIPGTPGTDGKSSYLHIKYSNDGGVTFTDGNGETLGIWIGTYVDENLLDSDDISDYRWKKFVGEDGKDGIGYTIALSNENHGFVADGNGIVQAEQIQIKVCAWLGIEPIATTVTVPELPVGMTATVSNNGTDTTYITLNVDSALTDTQGTVEFGVTADSVNFVKVFSWSVNRGGKDGKPGTVYGIDSSSTSAVYNIRNSECTPSSVSFNAYYSEGDSKEKLPLDCYMQISYTSTGSTWIKYGDRLHCLSGTTAFNFLSTSHLDGLPVNTETGIITAVKCEIFATETSDTAYASKEITIVPSMNELAVLGFVEENNTIYVDGSNFYAGSIHTSALAAEVIKSIGCEYSSSSVYATKGTYFDLATGALASQNFAIDTNGNAFFKGEITATSGKLGNWNIGDSSIYYAGNTTYTNDESAFNNSGSMYFGTSGLSLGKKFVYDKSTDTLTVTGNIVANSLTLGSGVTIDADDISGLGSEVSYYVGQSGAIIKGKTYSGNEYSSEDKQTALRSFSVSSNGLLEAQNAIIYGTIYASAGSFTGTVYATDGSFKGDINATTITAKGTYNIYNGSGTSYPFAVMYGSWIDIGHIDGNDKGFFSFYNDLIETYAPLTVYEDFQCWDAICNNIYRGGSKNISIIRTDSSGNMSFGPQASEISSSQSTKLRGYNISIYSHNSSGKVTVNTTGSIAIASDENVKDLYELDSRYEQFFMNLEPVTYVYKYSGHRKHIGFGARQVEQALIDAGLTTEQFAGILIDKDTTLTADELGSNEDVHFDELYSLRYEEFISLNTKMIQKCMKRINALEEEIGSLKELL